MTKTRRQFLNETFASCSSFAAAAALTSLGQRFAHGASPHLKATLRPVQDETTGLPLVRLPEGFVYQSFGWTKDPMDDGTPTPAAHDGMGVVSDQDGILTLVRNHEISSDGSALPIQNGSPFDAQAQGGCTTLKFDTNRGKWLSSRVSLSGTSRNCAGGITPWGTWLTAEETVLGVDSIDRYKNDRKRKFKQEHGWIFEVDPAGVIAPQPLTAMGRFVHEAVAVDAETSIVYETEDRGTSGFYRFIPNERENLSAGGKLQIMSVVGQSDLRGGFENGAEFDVEWHTIPNPEQANTPALDEPDELGVYKQGKSLGGSTFSRLEGCWSGEGMIFFDATSGGTAKAGQIWQYDPKADRLKLLFESPAKPVLNMPDNLCVRPGGGLVLCEDNDYGANQYPQRMFALSQDGELILLAENNVILEGERNGFHADYRNKEWAGACFSPDGKWLFANLQTPGITLAITGPWEDVWPG